MDIDSVELLSILRAQKRGEKIPTSRCYKIKAYILGLTLVCLYFMAGCYSNDVCKNTHDYYECLADRG